MKKRTPAAALAAAAFLAGSLLSAGAGAQTVKVGVVLPYTGVGAELAQQIDRGMQMYLKLNPNALGSYKIELVKRDSKNPSGAEAKTAVQELITQDKVDILTGFVYSPDAIASAPLVTEAKKPMIIMNAGTAWITNLSPMISRVSFSMWHAGFAMGDYAAKVMKAKTAVVGYTDYPPGKDSLEAFKRGFETNGGKVIDEIPMGSPAKVPDFTPFFQRAKDKKPDVFFVFVPAGDHALAVAKTYGALGMRQAGIKLIGPGDITQDIKLQSMGERRRGADYRAPLQRRPRQPGQQALCCRLEEGVRRRLDAGFHGGAGLRRHGGDRPHGRRAEGQDRRRWRHGDAQRLEIRQSAAARS